MQKTTPPTLEERRYSIFTSVENTIGNSPKVPRTRFLGSDGLFDFIGICKFCSFKNTFVTTTSLSELISMNYGSSTSSWKPWSSVRLNLVLSIGDTYIYFNLKPLTKFTSSSKSTEFKDILTWKISQMIMNNVPVSMQIVISYAMKQGISL